MAKNIWNSIAPDFEDEVMEITKSDLYGTLKNQVNEISSLNKTAADLGCGAGSLLPLLTDKFKTVYAIDGAEELLNVARDKYYYSNVDYLCHDLSKNTKLPVVADVTFCVNVLINPSHEDRIKILKKVSNATKPGGLCIVVVPSMESELHMYQTLVRHKEKGKTKYKHAVSEVNKLFKNEVVSPVEGIVDIGGSLTKCYIREEIGTFLSQADLNVEDVKKLEYSWKEIIDSSSQWLKEPYPWDWLIVARKSSTKKGDGEIK